LHVINFIGSTALTIYLDLLSGQLNIKNCRHVTAFLIL